MESRFRFRLYLLTAMILLGVFSLLHRLHQFQIKDQHYYIRQKPGFSVVAIREPGVRGEILDRNGVPLAENYRIYELVVNLGEVRESWIRQWKVEKSVGEETDEKPPEIDKIVERLILPRLKELGVEPRLNRTAIRTHYVTHGDLVPYVFPGELDFDQFSRLAEHKLGLQGVYVNSRPQRRYPMGTLAGHVLGYVQQWKKGTYTPAEKAEFAHYFGDSKGVSGIEKTYNDILTGLHGKRSLYKDEKNNIIGRTVDSRAPGQGAELTLTLDAGIQCLTENVLRKAGRAAAVVMDVNTGEVLAMASVPNYDPNDYVPSLTQKSADYYFQNKGHPFTNRAVSSYQSGSTTKIPVALTALMNGQAGFADNCRGYVAFGRTKIRCWHTAGHGTLRMDEALQRSCNPYFMDLANRMGREKMVEGFSALNLGRRTGVGLPEEKPGILPGSQHWLQLQEPGSIVTPSQVALMAIGQWDMEATPLQICAITACVANGGTYYQPRLLKKATLLDDTIVPDVPKVELDLVKDKGVSRNDIKRVQHGMWLAANAPGGTAGRVAIKDYTVAAKTGTVQKGTPPNHTNNAWVTAFAPYDEPRYSVTVFVEGGKSGGKVAGPLAHMILRGIAATEKGLRLPTKRMGKFAGHFDPIEEIELPEDALLSITLEDVGETGDEVSEALDENKPVKVKPRIIPLPGGGSGQSEDADE
ncbi:peptidoglycan D,D-transpeptidase FtsI family protein [Roseibacillus persicicus]|uniref:beta-lactamase n=1 Tax=Roseibacillus persicicus TaxID=454148 RepID=A0A918WHB2_9BACT|nr:penicillin-binding transpeptidase domain-containing protein [Roseibacillus persicicus]GHC47665.1 penicillin-binding protein 2 [Roseibacillus persicicus]